MRWINNALMILLITLHAAAQVPDDFLDEDEPETPPGVGAPNGSFGGPPGAQPGAGLPGSGPGAGMPGALPGQPPGPGQQGAESPMGGGKFKGNKTSGATGKGGRKIPFSQAQPEDITNENYPDLIDSFDYPDADIADLVKAMSELTGKNFILEPGVHGKISIIAPTPITVAEAYKAFLSALAINGFTIVPAGKFLKVRASRNAMRDSMDIYSGAYTPNTDQMVTRIVQLRYIQADDVGNKLQNLKSTNGDMMVYPPTNSIIITDFGTNIERIMKIIAQLDVPGFEEKLEVIPIRHAKAKEIADLIDQIINKGSSKKQGSGFVAGIPRFNAPGQGGGSSQAYSLVLSDDRSNAIIVVGNETGIKKIRALVNKLDYNIRPEDAGGIYVYYVKYGDAEKISEALQGVTKDKKTTTPGSSPGNEPSPYAPPVTTPPAGNSAGLFGGDVKIVAMKDTNSLIITASKQDYQVVLSLLGKLDIAKDQVFVEVVIMELNAAQTDSWGITYYQFDPATNGVGRAGFSGAGDLTTLLDATKDTGAILGFGSGSTFQFQAPGGPAITVTSFASFLKFLKQNISTNVLSTPQILAMDNEEAEIEVGDDVPIGSTTATSNNVTTTGQQREKATIHLTLTPYISPNGRSVRMKLKQDIKQLSQQQVAASQLAATAVTLTERSVKSNIVVPNGDTAVLGGLMREQEDITETKIPVLGDIPILGWLFKGKSTQKKKLNLLVFITPKIIRNSEDQKNLLGQKLNQRLDFIKTSLGGRDPFGKTVDGLYKHTSKSGEALDKAGNSKADSENKGVQ